MGEPEHETNHGSAGVPPVVDMTRQEDAHERRQYHKYGHLNSQRTSFAGPGPRACDRAEGHQAEEDNGPATRMHQGVRAGLITDQGGNYVAASAHETAEKDKLVRPIPRFYLRSQQVHCEHIQYQMRQAIMDKVA